MTLDPHLFPWRTITSTSSMFCSRGGCKYPPAQAPIVGSWQCQKLILESNLLTSTFQQSFKMLSDDTLKCCCNFEYSRIHKISLCVCCFSINLILQASDISNTYFRTTITLCMQCALVYSLCTGRPIFVEKKNHSMEISGRCLEDLCYNKSNPVLMLRSKK